MEAQIREVIRTHGRIGTDVDRLSTTDDLYAAGLTSHASVNVMLALEDAFDVEFPDELLRRDTFGSIAAMERALSGLVTP